MSDLFVARGMTKRYAGVTVLRDVDFDLRGGEIHALLGANGAGKSTLCKMIAGLTDVTEGQMSIDGRRYWPAHKQAAEAAGVQIIQQELNLIGTLTVAENLLFSHLPSIAGIVRGRSLHRLAREALDRLNLGMIDTRTVVSELGVGTRQMVEIAAALSRQCKILILDEPTAALSGSEAELLFEQLAQLRRRGVGMIYISHRLDEVKRIADRATVLRDGCKVSTQACTAVSTDQMVELMSGEVTSTQPSTPQQTLDVGNDNAAVKPCLSVNRLCCGLVQEVSFDVAAGETLGITGLVGAGRTELLRAIFGADVATSGNVSVSGGPRRRYTHPANAVAAGMAMVTEDRKDNGLLLQQSICVNTTLGALRKQFSRFGVIKKTAEANATERICRSMETRCTSIQQHVALLSGGNQQKVAIAKWLTRGADVFLFDEPTRGIDVGARRRIYQLFDELSRAGKGIVIVSSDLDELFQTCDRIGVMSAGRLVEIRDRASWSEESILQASFVAHRSEPFGTLASS